MDPPESPTSGDDESFRRAAFSATPAAPAVAADAPPSESPRAAGPIVIVSPVSKKKSTAARMRRFDTLPAPVSARGKAPAANHSDDSSVTYDSKFDQDEDDDPKLQFVASPLNLEPSAEGAKRIVLEGEKTDEQEGTLAALHLTQDITEEDRTQLGGTDPELVDLLRNNRDWIRKTMLLDSAFFTRMGRGQSPKYFYIGCSDSRVDPCALMGLPPGSMFVHRNIGGLVCPCDMNCHSALEYAVEVLQVKHIIVGGHYDCGAVKASMRTGLSLPPLVEYWIRNIRDVHRQHQQELNEIEDFEAMHQRLVELNVIEQCLNIFKVGLVQKKRRDCVEKGDRFLLPRIHGTVFDPADGKVVKLNLTWNQHPHVRRIYDLNSHDQNAKIWFGDQKHAPMAVAANATK